MYQCIRTTQNLIRCTKRRLLIRSATTVSPGEDDTLPKYRDRASRYNNPYQDLFRNQKGKKPTTFRDRFIEAKRNEPKPKIGTGDKPKDFINFERGTTQRKLAFYRDQGRVTFSELGILPELSRQIAELGVVYPTHHQSDVIPVLLENRNCVFISPTGSGKTYTYLLPIVQNLIKSKEEGYITKSGAPRIIIMAPTRFLALQIGLVVNHLIQELDLRAVCLTELGNQAQSREINGYPIDILIGTNDNIVSWISSGNVSTSDLQHLVIDEADDYVDYRKVAENGVFLKEFVDPENGLTKCQIILAGAIMNQAGFKAISDMVPGIERYLNSRSHVPLQHVQQRFCFVNNKHKPQHIVQLLQDHLRNSSSDYQRPLIFCNFANTAFWLHKHLISHGVDNIHVGKGTPRRFRNNLMRNEIPNTDYPIVTTDSFGYGLDIREIGLVVNYEFPFTYEDYIRRIGRTGRMSSNSNQCEAVSYVSYTRDKALYNIVKNSTAHKECLAASLLSTNRYGWLRN